MEFSVQNLSEHDAKDRCNIFYFKFFCIIVAAKFLLRYNNLFIIWIYPRYKIKLYTKCIRKIKEGNIDSACCKHVKLINVEIMLIRKDSCLRVCMHAIYI